MSDNLACLCCPACGKKMHKIFIPAKNIFLDICLDGCGGIYFDNRELNKFAKSNDDITPLIEAYNKKTFISVDETEQRTCPVCNTIMNKNIYNPKCNVLIDECYCCGGKFLDYKELDKIRGDASSSKDYYYSSKLKNNYKMLEEAGFLLTDNLQNDETGINSQASSNFSEMPYNSELTRVKILSLIKGFLFGALLSYFGKEIIFYFYPIIQNYNLNLSPVSYFSICSIIIIYCICTCSYVYSVNKFKSKYKII